LRPETYFEFELKISVFIRAIRGKNVFPSRSEALFGLTQRLYHIIFGYNVIIAGFVFTQNSTVIFIN
jgi:hypothetical protein